MKIIRVLLLGIAALLIALIVFLVRTRDQDAATLELKEIELTPGTGTGISMLVEIADETEELRQGLMFRRSLGADTGMFFVFSEQDELAFWMQNTLIPLDILFFGANGRFVSRTTMIPCTEDPCTTYPSIGPAQYALEVTAGNALVAEVGSGWTVTIK